MAFYGLVVDVGYSLQIDNGPTKVQAQDQAPSFGYNGHIRVL